MNYKKCAGVIAKNSLDYIDIVFSCLNERKCIINIKNRNDVETISRFDLDKLIEPKQTTGWYHGVQLKPYHTEDIAQILFTSGTEGKPKGILLSHRALSDTSDRLVEVMSLDDSVREYIGVPVYYSFGFGRCRAIDRAGGTFFVPENGFNPIEIADMLQSGAINSISAVPTLWRILLDGASLFDEIGNRLKWIEIGSQYMSRDEKEALKELFPNARIVQHYGLTEASRSTFLVVSETSGRALESVGSCIGDGQVRLSGEGKIQIRGSHLASKVVKEAPEALTDQEGWFTTNDLGELSGGMLYYLGRADDQINCGGVKVSPEHLEQQVYSRIGASKGVAITGIDDALRGQRILCAYSSDCSATADDIEQALAQVLQTISLDAKAAYQMWSCDALPMTATGKLQRKKLSEVYQQRIAASSSSEPGADENDTPSENQLDPLAAQLKSVWGQALSLDVIPTDRSFFDIGGDSLSSIIVSTKMEKLGLSKEHCQKIFKGYSIDQIVNETNGCHPKNSDHLEGFKITFGLNFIRGIMVLLVISAHWMPGVVERLPEAFQAYNVYFSVLYSAGTPAFAIIFGIGVGFFFVSRYVLSEKSTVSLIKKNVTVLGIGLIVLCLVRLVNVLTSGGQMTPLVITNSFYGVVFYYFFAMGSVPFWLRLAKCVNFHYSYFIGVSILFYGIHLLIESLEIAPSQNAILQGFNLLITAKYNYFEMSAGVFIGMFLGDRMRVNKKIVSSSTNWFLAGIALFAVAFFISIESSKTAYWLIWPKPLFLWSWVFYYGFVLVLLSFSMRIQTERRTAMHFVFRLISCFGILAFPLFISHEMVIPIKDILAGIAFPMPLVTSMMLFLIFVYYSVNKIYKTYYSG